MEFFEQYGIYIIVFSSMMVISFIAVFISNKRNKKNVANFLEKYPDVARVYLTMKALITQEAVSVYLVNGEQAVLFTEKGKSGFYLAPGNNEVEMSYSYTRPGVMYKSVTKSTGAVTRELEVEANKSYKLSFDRKQEEFVFEELDK